MRGVNPVQLYLRFFLRLASKRIPQASYLQQPSLNPRAANVEAPDCFDSRICKLCAQRGMKVHYSLTQGLYFASKRQ
jgi:hypothetical protein